DAVAFRVVEINRPGVAVTNWTDRLAAGRAHLAKSPLHIGKTADVERNLLHHRGFEIGLAARYQDHLVMVAGVAAQKRDAAVGCRIADDETEDAGIEILHFRQVGYVEPDMAQARCCFLRHDRALLEPGMLSWREASFLAQRLSNAARGSFPDGRGINPFRLPAPPLAIPNPLPTHLPP